MLFSKHVSKYDLAYRIEIEGQLLRSIRARAVVHVKRFRLSNSTYGQKKRFMSDDIEFFRYLKTSPYCVCTRFLDNRPETSRFVVLKVFLGIFSFPAVRMYVHYELGKIIA